MTELDDRDLERRLAAVAPELPGADWLDVRRRARRRDRRRILTAALAAALALVVAVPALGVDDRILGFLGITAADEDVPAADVGHPYVYGRTLHGFGRPRELAAPLRPALIGEAAAIAVPSPDGRYVAYHTSRGATPILRVYDLETDRDRVLAEGAHTVAWGERGLAYFQADPPAYRPRRAFAGRVVVRETPESPPVTWVGGAGQYSVVAWAGKRLVIEARGCNLPAAEDEPSGGPFCGSALEPGTYVLDGPGRARSLGPHRISAVSPDGRLGFGPLVPPGQDSPTATAHVVDVASGRRVATLDLVGHTPARLSRSLDPAAWTDETIAVVATVEPSLVLLRFRDGELTFTRALRLPPHVLADTAGPNFSTPVFADGAEREVVLRVSGEYPDAAEYRGVRAFLTCDLAADECRMGRALREGASLGVVFNPSRPAGRVR